VACTIAPADELAWSAELSGGAALGEGDADQAVEVRGGLEPLLDSALANAASDLHRVQHCPVDQAGNEQEDGHRVEHGASIEAGAATATHPLVLSQPAFRWGAAP
jgi:hypothetical protein